MQAAASQATTTLEVEFERASQKLSVLEAAQDRKEAASPKSPAASPWQSPFSEHAARARKLKLRRMALDGYLAERAVASKAPSHSAVLASEQRLSLDEARAWIAAELRSKSSRAAAGSRNTVPWRTHGARPAAQAALNVSRHERARREPLAASTMVPPPTREARIAMAAAMCHGSREPAATSLMTSPAVGLLSGRERPAASASARAAAAQAAHLVRLLPISCRVRRAMMLRVLVRMRQPPTATWARLTRSQPRRRRRALHATVRRLASLAPPRREALASPPSAAHPSCAVTVRWRRPSASPPLTRPPERWSRERVGRS